MQREIGWYWVKRDEWECAQWDGEAWWVINHDAERYDFHMDEIGPRIAAPDEQSDDLDIEWLNRP